MSAITDAIEWAGASWLAEAGADVAVYPKVDVSRAHLEPDAVLRAVVMRGRAHWEQVAEMRGEIDTLRAENRRLRGTVAAVGSCLAADVALVAALASEMDDRTSDEDAALSRLTGGAV